MIIDGKKYCGVCKHFLPIESFYPNNQKGDGYQNVCKQCQKRMNHKRWFTRKKERLRKIAETVFQDTCKENHFVASLVNSKSIQELFIDAFCKGAEYQWYEKQLTEKSNNKEE